jgi:hypothetical protein
MGIILKIPRTATILVVENCDLLLISRNNYLRLINNLENIRLE